MDVDSLDEALNPKEEINEEELELSKVKRIKSESLETESGATAEIIRTRSSSPADSFKRPKTDSNDDLTVVRRRSTTKIATPPRVGKYATVTRAARARPALNRDALSSTLPTPPQTDKPLPTANTVKNLEEENKQKELREFVRRKLMTESALSSSALYRARRCSVMQPSNMNSPIQAELDLLKTRNRSSTVGVTEKEKLFGNQKQKLLSHLESTLEDPWKRDLFKRYLQEKHKEIYLNFFLQVKGFYLSVKKVEELDTSSDDYLDHRNALRDEGRKLCGQFISDSSFPKDVSNMLREVTLPLLCRLVPCPNSDTFSIDMSTTSDELNSDSEPLSSEFSYSSSDEENDCFASELDSDSMALLGTNDPRLLTRSYASIKPFLVPKEVNPKDTKKIIEGFAFFVADRKLCSYLIEFYSEFICSHNQISNMSRTYSDLKVKYFLFFIYFS